MGSVLVIDDDDVMRELLASLLTEAGFRVFELPSPIGATRTILSEGVDVVLLDVFMPEMNGDKSAKLLRENPRLRGLAIVLISSSEPAKLLEIADRVKADAIVCKADARLSLVSTVRAAMRSKSQLKRV